MNLRLILMVLGGFLPTFATAADIRPSYAGRYEWAGSSSQLVFKLSLSQKGSRVHAIFFASDTAQPGSQPTAEGDGRVNDEGVLEFKFKDNLANKGTATLAHAKNLYRLEMRVTNIADAAPLHFYGVLTMKKIGDVPPVANPPSI